MAKTFQTNKKAIRLSLAILAGLILGALFGLVMPDWAEPVTSFISTVYLHGLTMMIYPLVFCSLIVGIKGIGSVSATGKVGGQALLYFIGTTLFASLLGLFLPKALNIGAGVAVEMAEAEVQAAEFTSEYYPDREYYEDGKFHIMSGDGDFMYPDMAIVTGLYELADGTYMMCFTAYNPDPDYYIEYDELYKYDKKATYSDSHLTWKANGVAYVKPYKYKGRDTYQLISMEVYSYY